MSHFSVLVVTDTRPDGVDGLTRILQPWHEFECTGINDEYVVDIDKTAATRETYDKDDVRRFRSADGILHSPYEDEFYREFTDEETASVGHSPMGSGGNGAGLSWSSKDWHDGRGYRAKVHFVPADYTDVQVPRAEVETFAEYLSDYEGIPTVEFGASPDLKGEHSHGYALLDEAGEVTKVVERTNPNAKWDWWKLGGRYIGRLHVLPGMEGDAEKGQAGLMTPNPDGNVFDIARVGALDLPAMKEAQKEVRRGWIAEIVAKTGASAEDVEAAIKLDPIIRDAWWSQTAEPRPRGPDFYAWSSANCEGGDTHAKVARAAFDLPKLGRFASVAEWIEGVPALTAWAVIHNGEWTERGSMGWFGMSSGDRDEDEWHASVAALIESLPPTSWVSIVDCHI